MMIMSEIMTFESFFDARYFRCNGRGIFFSLSLFFPFYSEGVKAVVFDHVSAKTSIIVIKTITGTHFETYPEDIIHRDRSVVFFFHFLISFFSFFF